MEISAAFVPKHTGDGLARGERSLILSAPGLEWLIEQIQNLPQVLDIRAEDVDGDDEMIALVLKLDYGPGLPIEVMQQHVLNAIQGMLENAEVRKQNDQNKKGLGFFGIDIGTEKPLGVFDPVAEKHGMADVLCPRCTLALPHEIGNNPVNYCPHCGIHLFDPEPDTSSTVEVTMSGIRHDATGHTKIKHIEVKGGGAEVGDALRSMFE
jgi:hypothetical protein